MHKHLENLAFYLHNFHSQDFILLGTCFLFFIIILILAIFLRHFAVFSIFLIIIGFVGEVFLIIKGQDYIINNYRQSEIKIIKNQKLAFSDNIFLEFELHNNSNTDFKICKVEVKIQKPSKNRYQKIKNYLKPLKTIKLDVKNIYSKDKENVKLLVPSKAKKYTLYTKAICF